MVLLIIGVCRSVLNELEVLGVDGVGWCVVDTCNIRSRELEIISNQLCYPLIDHQYF